MEKVKITYLASFKKSVFLVLFLFVLIFPIRSFSVSNLITFPDKIDTLQERKNIQIVLNRVIVPSLNLVVDGVIGRGTIRAIQIFQELKGLVSDGKIGPITRLALETAQNISSTSGCAPGALFNTINGQPCVSIPNTNLPSGCLSSTGFSTITGQPCSGILSTNLPLGCSSTSGYSTITGLSCGIVTPPVGGGGGGGGSSRGGSNSGGENITVNKYLVKDNIGYAEIIISPAAPNMVEIAANDLQLYIQKMTGATLPISTVVNENITYHIYVGQSIYTDALGINDDDCEFDSFKMVSGDNYLVLLGNDDIINIPEPYTKRWSSEGTAVRAAWDLITGHTWETPYILYLKNYNPQYDIWEGDGRGSINAVYKFLYNQGVRWYYPGEIGEVVPVKTDIILPVVNTHIRPDFEMRNMFMYYKQFVHGSVDYLKWQLRLGLNSGEGSLGISRGHGINNITSRSETKIAHPEYYAIWGGVRQNGDDQKQDLCSTGLLNENINFVKAMFAHYNNPSENVMPADGFIHVSESSQECINKETPERGYEGQISDYVFEYVNNVAKEVYKTYPNKNIATSAYTAYLLPPLTINQFSPNVSITMSKWRSDFADPEEKEFYKDLTNSWLSKIPSKRIYTYDYYLHNMPERQNSSVPYYFPHIIAEDLQFLKGKSKGEFIEVSTNLESANLGWDTFAAQALNVYITAQLYWDADQNVDTLLNEYYNLYYGPASSKMKNLIEYSEDNYINVPNDPTILVHLRQLANEAKAIAGNTIYGQRIDLILGLINSRYAGSDTTINSCQTLNSPTTTYKLNADVLSSGTCFNITDDDITLDCQGHTITYGTAGGVNNHGINIDTQGLFNIKNCVIQNGNSSSGYGIRVNNSETGGLIKDNNINISSNTFAVYVMGSKNVDLENNIIISSATGVQFYDSSNGNITNNQISGNSNMGFYLYSSTNNTLTNNTISSNLENGVQFILSDDNTFNNNTISSVSKNGLWLYNSSDNNDFDGDNVSSSNSVGIRIYGNSNNNTFVNQTVTGGTSGIEIGSSSNTLVKDCVNVSGTTRDMYVYSEGGASNLNNVVTNCPYDVELVSGTNTELIRKWYLDVTVSDSSGAKISGATVNSYNSSGGLESTSATNSEGVTRQELIEYDHVGGTKVLKTPHTITISKSGYNPNSTVINLTQTNSIEHNVILSSGVLGVSKYNFSQNLKVGSSGNEVMELQKFLINKGYLKILNPTFIFGPLTEMALEQYQKANNLEIDGVVGPKTREVLNR